jgi:hypothetical protein
VRLGKYQTRARVSPSPDRYRGAGCSRSPRSSSVGVGIARWRRSRSDGVARDATFASRHTTGCGTSGTGSDVARRPLVEAKQTGE